MNRDKKGRWRISQNEAQREVFTLADLMKTPCRIGRSGDKILARPKTFHGLTT